MKKYLNIIIGVVLIATLALIPTLKAEAVIVDSGSISLIDSTDIMPFPDPFSRRRRQ